MMRERVHAEYFIEAMGGDIELVPGGTWGGGG